MGKKDVPVQGKINEFEQYDLIILGFPIWYYSATNVVNTFCKGYDWTGKNIGVFATSGGSEIGKTIEKLQPYVKGGSLLGGKVVKNEEELAEWIDCLR
jgi:flavodoxin